MPALTLVGADRRPARPSRALPRVVRQGDAGWSVLARSLDDRDAEPTPDAEVRAAVVAITAALRESGLPPERVLVLVKGIVRGAHGGRRVALPPHELEARMSRIVGWTIEAYYQDASTGHANG